MTRVTESESPCNRWLVLVACFVCHMTNGSVTYHVGVLHVALLDTYDQDVVTTAWLCAAYSSLPLLVGPVASLIITTFDCRTCLILSGILAAVGTSSCFFITRFIFLYPALIIAGAGQGFSLVTSYVAIGYNFPHQASLLTGICVCGSGLGTFIHPPLLQTLVDYFGLHGAMLVLGAVSLNAVACGLAIPPSDYEKQRHLARKRDAQSNTFRNVLSSFISHVDVLRDFRFLLLLVTSFGFSAALGCYYVYLPDFLLHNRYDHLTASFVLSATGMGSIPSRLLTGVASNDVNIDNTTFFFGIHAMAAVVTFLVPFTVNSVVAQMVLSVLFGVYTGAVWASYSPFLLELLGVRRVTDGLGMYLFTMGIGYVASPPLAGKMYTLSNNFHHVFYFIGAMFALASAAGMLSILVKGREEEHSLAKTWRHSADTSIDIPESQQQRATDSLLQEDKAVKIVIIAEINGRDKDSLCSFSRQSGADNAEERDSVVRIRESAKGPLVARDSSCVCGQDSKRVCDSGKGSVDSVILTSSQHTLNRKDRETGCKRIDTETADRCEDETSLRDCECSGHRLGLNALETRSHGKGRKAEDSTEGESLLKTSDFEKLKPGTDCQNGGLKCTT